MPKLTPREVVLAALAHEEVRPVPCSLEFEGNIGDALDVHYGNTAWRRRLPRYIVGVRSFNTDMKKPTADPALMTDPYGTLWRVDKRPWHIVKPPLEDAPKFGNSKFPDADQFMIPNGVETATAQALAARENSFVFAGVGWGLFERSWTMRGFENALMDMIDEEDFYGELLDKLTDLYLEFVERACVLPVDGLLFGDDWGEQRGVIMGAALWRKWFKPRWGKIFGAVHRHGKVTMCHSCGSVAEIVPDLIEIGLDVLESVQPEAAGMQAENLKPKYGKNISFWGGLGSQKLLPFGTPTEIASEARRLSQIFGAGGGYILAPAKPLQPETPLENAAALVEYMSGDREF